MGCENSKESLHMGFEEQSSSLDLTQKGNYDIRNTIDSESPPTSDRICQPLFQQKAKKEETSIAPDNSQLKPQTLGVVLNTIAFEFRMDTPEMEEELSEIVEELFEKYDTKRKGHLSSEEFQRFLMENAKHSYTKDEVDILLRNTNHENQEGLDRVGLYKLCYSTIQH